MSDSLSTSEPHDHAEGEPEFAHQQTFAGLSRVLGEAAYQTLPELRICVVGIGGVGSWTAEALARTGVGHITMIDHDDVCVTNINRQLHALHTTLDQSKVQIMRDRIAEINPQAEVHAEDDFVAEKNIAFYLGREFDVVIDAIDSIRFKAAMIAYCRRNKIRIITTGGAGGRVDPGAVGIVDLSRTWNDALAAKVRSRLRSDYGFTTNPKRKFGVDCVFSSEQPVYPDGKGGVSHAKPGVPGASLDCASGYGAVSFVTGTFGFFAAAIAVKRALAQRLRSSAQAVESARS